MAVQGRRVTYDPTAILIMQMGDIRQRVADLESTRTRDIQTAVSQATASGLTPANHSITDLQVVVNGLTGASLSLGLALQGTLSTPYGFVMNSTGLFLTAPSSFAYNSTVTDPDPGVNRDAKFGNSGIAVKGGTKTDTLNVTGATTLVGSAGVTITSSASFSTSAITLSQPLTIGSSVVFSSSSITFTGRPIMGSAVAFDTITGGAGAGTGNIAAGTVQGYNVMAASLPFSVLTGTAVTQITALTVQDTPFSLLRRVTPSGTAVDANGNPIDGMVIYPGSGATRVADTLAYAGEAISTIGMTTTSTYWYVNGPNYTGLVPGNYTLTFYLRTTSTPTTTGTAVSLLYINPIIGSGIIIGGTGGGVQITDSMLTNSYQGFTVPFTVTSTTNALYAAMTNYTLPGTYEVRLSHIYVQPSAGVVTSNAVDAYFASASITSAKIATLAAGKIVAGTITSDNIFLGTGGHIYAGTSTMSPTGMTARIEMNAAGFYGYDGTQNTFALINTGLTMTGTINATGGTITGSLTVTGTLSGGTISGATITGGTLTGTLTNSATINGGTIVGALIETNVTSTVSRSVMDSTFGVYVSREATTNYVLNPTGAYSTPAANGYGYPTLWKSGRGVVAGVGTTYILSFPFEFYGTTTRPIPPTRSFVAAQYQLNKAGITAIAPGTTSAILVIGAFTFTCSGMANLAVGDYVVIGANAAAKILSIAAGVATVDIAWTVASASGTVVSQYDVDIIVPMANLAASTTYTVTINLAGSARQSSYPGAQSYYDASRLAVQETSGALRLHSYSGYSTRYTAAPNTWAKVTFTFTTEANWAGPSQLVLSGARSASGSINVSSGDYMMYANLQVEAKAYATDYTDGDLGTAYSWSGTAGQSSSARAVQQVIQLPHLGAPQVRGVIKTDGLNFPLNNLSVIPDSVTGTASQGGLDIAGRGVQTTLWTYTIPTWGPLAGAGPFTVASPPNQVTIYTGRLYRITWSSNGGHTTLAPGGNVDYVMQLHFVYWDASGVTHDITHGVGWFQQVNVANGGSKVFVQDYSWFFTPTVDMYGCSVYFSIGSGVAGYNVNGTNNTVVSVTDMGVSR
ncbi:MAG: hypothetical protein M3O41_09375 [Pseudomonadota bacterium]|nr:hypothetical protein [Pseudomonadota bacterium]